MQTRFSESLWVTVWLRPRSTVRNVLEREQESMLLAIVVLGTFYSGLSSFRVPSGIRGGVWPDVLTSLLVGALFGLLFFYLEALLIDVAGSWLDGKASYVEVQAAIAVSRIPLVWGLLIWAVKLAVFGERAFPRGPDPGVAQINIPAMSIALTGGSSTPALAVTGLLAAVIGIWAFIILLRCLAEVQGYSMLSAFLNVVLAFAIPIIPLALALSILPIFSAGF